MQLDSVFEVERDGESARFEPFKRLPHHRLLWHGSRTANYIGILSQVRRKKIARFFFFFGLLTGFCLETGLENRSARSASDGILFRQGYLFGRYGFCFFTVLPHQTGPNSEHSSQKKKKKKKKKPRKNAEKKTR